MRNRFFLMLIASLFLCLSVKAQSGGNISGKVVDALGELAGVSVVVKGTGNGTITDMTGEFKLSGVKPGDVLQLSFIGYKTQQIKVGTQTRFNITMVEDAQTLDEVQVVAVGYGDVRRRDLTGSIGSADMKDLIKTPVSNITENLAGRIAGVQVSSSDGGPGDNFSIVIRGAGSLTGSTAPLYVVDGFPSETSGLSALNPNDIESIDILKDASATAIYGARGANGVVIITTKKGGAGKPTITYNGSFKISTVKNKPEMMDAYEFVTLQQEIMGDGEDFQNNYLTDLYPTVEDYRNAPSYDWQDYIYRTALSHSHHVSLTGGANNLKYTTSLSYDDTQGVIINSGIKRYQGRANLTQTVNDKLKIDFNANYSSNVQDGPTVSTSTTSMSTAYMYSVWSFRPVSPTGSDLLNQMYDEGVNMTEDYRFNPVLSARNEYRHKTTNDMSFNVGAEYELIKNLKLKVTAGYTARDYKNEEFNGSQTRTGNSHPSNTQSKGINAYLYQSESRSYLNENTLTYQLNKKSHSFNALVGMSVQKNTSYIHSITTEQISNESFGMAGLDKGSNPTVTSSKGENKLFSYFGRINYNYDSRYYLTATMRADGSSKFAKGHRWGYFPSGSVAWAFQREAFVSDNLHWLSNGKLRFSYGQTGNNRIGNYDYMAHLVTSDDVYKYPWNGEFTQGYVLSSMFNELLKWETTEQFDLGLDLGFLDGRINLTMDYYVKTTKDLLLDADIAASSGFSSATLNVGKLRNKGFELTLETTNIKNKDFTWTSNFNIAFNNNEIIALNSGQPYMTSYISWDNKYRTMPAYISKVGESAGKMYGFVYEGTYKYDDFNTSVGANGETVYTIKDGIPHYQSNPQPGDPKYKDLTGEGEINDDDKTAIGNGQPKHTGGFSNNFTYKNFDLNIFLQWSYGNDILNANRMVFENPSSKQNTNMFATYTNRWTPENPESNMPRARAEGSAEYSSLYVENGSYLKLKNISLGYNFGPKVLDRLGISAARIYLAAENIATFTHYSGSDPEVSTRNSVLTPGFDWSAYPRAFSMSFGLNVTF
ncbi:MAG: TonB-dependent receptor [Candidatus Phocaeicola excrementipullorum]|uniref:TonB-dependent receptor n=1 Tax=Candidatus Phocaeicola excrementipullorum TaxID=2838731 RepID=A0A948TM64_9BACT|nr:TonB-dependent receptor [Candidatus Phocaeicola excrementipullorum]